MCSGWPVTRLELTNGLPIRVLGQLCSRGVAKGLDAELPVFVFHSRFRDRFFFCTVSFFFVMCVFYRK